MAYCSYFPEAQARETNALAYKIRPTDWIYVFPPYSIRHVLKTTIMSATKLIYVVTLKDVLTTQYHSLLEGFDYCVSLGQHYKMVLKPNAKKVIIDDFQDTFDYYHSISGLWLLTKGYNIEGRVLY